MLSNLDILTALKNGEISITPFDESRLSPASYDLSLGPIVRLVEASNEPLDLCHFWAPYSTEYDITGGDIVLMPGDCMLATTREVIGLGPAHGAQVRSKSSLGRLFQASDGTGAGWCDPGFVGEITLEIINFMPRPVIYTPGMLIAQLTFERADTPVVEDYTKSGQYSGQRGPTEARSIKMG